MNLPILNVSKGTKVLKIYVEEGENIHLCTSQMEGSQVGVRKSGKVRALRILGREAHKEN